MTINTVEYKETALTNMSRALKLFLSCSQALVRSNEESLLLHAICRIIVNIGGYTLSWVGFTKEANEAISPVAQMGHEAGYLGLLKITWGESDDFDPIAAVVKTGAACFIRNISDVPCSAVWQVEALERGYLSMCALPLKSCSGTFGTLNIYSENENAFSPLEECLLIGLADDLAYGVTALRAITARNRATEMLEHLHYYDSLTNLPNRVLLRERLDHELRHSERSKEKLAVLFLNLDQFNTLNDTLGYSAGNQLLQGVALRLQKCLRKCDTVGRMGGDEFIVLLPKINEPKNATRLAKRILHSLESPISMGTNRLNITATIGVSVYPENGIDAETLIQNAGIAMHYAKKHGKNNYSVYENTMDTKAFERMKFEGNMSEALKKKEFIIEYQPQISLRTGHIVGVEALLRWQHPDRGVISPLHFIPIAEETGLIIPIGEWVLKTVCKQNKDWQKKGYVPLPVAVNLSSRQLYHNVLPKVVGKVLRDTKLAPRWLALEIIEDDAVKDMYIAIENLSKLKKAGICIALDDFGTGYSSLNHLRFLPIDAVKVDRTFITNLEESDNRVIVKAIIDMAHTLKLKVIAEAVETEAQLNILLELGCDEAQGNLFSMPIPADKFEVMLAEKRQFSI